VKLTFLGAAGEVTGSSYLVETEEMRFLVDCGLFQGGREAERKNRARFAFDPRSLDFVLLTHAHIDHSGLLPRLAARGGNVIVPAFAVGRTQDILYVLADLHRQGRLPDLDVYVDSPMALAATEITLHHARLLDEKASALLAWLRKNHGGPRIRFVQELEESIALHRVKRGALIVSASGRTRRFSRPRCASACAGGA
jgi:Cft2 family RNA processing exonuclease